MAKFDYLPGSDDELNGWAEQFAAYASGHQVELDLSPAELAEINARVTGFVDALQESHRAHAASKAARVAKDNERAACETAIRAAVRRMQANPLVDDGERKNLGITVRDINPSRHGPPQTAPFGFVKEWFRGGHVLMIKDSESSGRARPKGTIGCEIWVKVGDQPPADGSECRYLITSGRSPYRVEFDGRDAGQTAHYMLRWVNRRGERGSWSETVSATITG